jgi:hypothetical protein
VLWTPENGLSEVAIADDIEIKLIGSLHHTDGDIATAAAQQIETVAVG